MMSADAEDEPSRPADLHLDPFEAGRGWDVESAAGSRAGSRPASRPGTGHRYEHGEVPPSPTVDQSFFHGALARVPHPASQPPTGYRHVHGAFLGVPASPGIEQNVFHVV